MPQTPVKVSFGSTLQKQFHVNHVEPPVEFETDLFELPDLFKAKPRVQGDAGGLAGVNARDDGVMAEFAGAGDQLLQQQRPDAATLMAGMDID